MNIIELLADDKRLITYRPKLNELTGSVTATILLQQIIFHFKNNKYAPFYKFKLPCQHRLYKSGDSWSEELGFTRSEFDTALKKIANKTSKKDIENNDKFVSYYTTSDRLTYYCLNESMLQNAVNQLYVKLESSFRKSDNLTLDLKQESSFTYTENTEITTENKGKRSKAKVKDIESVRKSKEPTKDTELFNSLKDYLLTKYKHYHNTEYSDFPKELRHIKIIIKKSKCDKVIIFNKLQIFEEKFKNPTSSYWSEMAFLPSKISGMWDSLNPPRKIVKNAAVDEDPLSEYEDFTPYKTKKEA